MEPTNNIASDLVVQPDGKILVVGSACEPTTAFGCDRERAVLARFDSDGSLDPTFSEDGKVAVSVPCCGSFYATSVVTQEDGKILAAGGNCFTAVRLTSDGRLDTSFGTGGLSINAFDTPGESCWSEGAYAAQIQPDGKLILAGNCDCPNNLPTHPVDGRTSDFGLMRLLPDGTLDPSFGTNGRVTSGFTIQGEDGTEYATADAIYDLAPSVGSPQFAAIGQCGTSETSSGPFRLGGFGAGQFESTGTLQNPFGLQCIQASGNDTVLPSESAYSGAFQADGKLVAAGFYRRDDLETDSYWHDFAILRYDSNGTLDSTFGDGGVVLTDFSAAPEVEPPGGGDPPAPLPPLEHVALGDSYSSGYGVGNYEPGTHKDGIAYPENDCQRSAGAYGPIVAEVLELPIVFKACGGATTHDFLHPRDDREDGSWGESAQFDYLGSSTKLLTFSIGGNDAGFEEHLAECIFGFELLPFNTCSGDERVTVPVREALDQLAGGQATDETADIVPYDVVFREARVRTPFATRVAVGYPEFYPEEGGDRTDLPGGRCEGVKKVDQRWIVRQIREINDIARQAAERNGFRFVVPSEGRRFESHELCGGGDEWFFPLLNPSPPPIKHPGVFHPTAVGQLAIAQAVLDRVNNPA
ncbi:MAG: GDSL-type esterase/lipase family protein, partial [Dehalococcoidia bacterium]